MVDHYIIFEQDNHVWIGESSYDPAFEAKTESLFALCNGNIGIRSVSMLPSLYGKRGLYASGLFHRAHPSEVTELVNCPDPVECRVTADGIKLSPDSPWLESCRREFCPDTAELRICMVFRLPEKKRLEVRETRLVSFADARLILQKISLKSLAGNFDRLELTGLLNGQSMNEGVSHFSEVICRVYDREVMHLEARLEEEAVSLMQICCGNREEDGPPLYALFRRGISEQTALSLKEGEERDFLRCSSLMVRNRREDNIYEQREELKAAARKGFDCLREKHLHYLSLRQRRCEFRIEGATREEGAILSFARYHLLGMMPWNRTDCSIASKGLTGEGYRGHVFWDTEIFMLPFFSLHFPEQSRNLLIYRYHGLAGAREKAEQFRYQGAMYPWESAADGREETPRYAALNIHTGKANPVWSGLKEHHVGADIVYAIRQYVDETGDRSFLKDYGYEMVFEIAAFWVSRAVWDPDRNQRVILDIIGPDEYTEHIDNNAYTNYMAAFCVKLALEYLKDAEKEAPEICRRLKTEQQKTEWEQFLREIYLPVPNEDGIIPQDDTFLDKEELPDIRKYREAPVRQTVLRDYSRKQIEEMQVLKQADTVMLLNMFPTLFSPEVVRKNVRYYEARTIHDSSLSYCAHALACAAIGEKKLAWKYFQNSLHIDLNDRAPDSVDGIHGAAMGGIWNCVEQGFAGISFFGGVLSVNPHLPDHWKSVEITLQVQGKPVLVKVTHTEVEVTTPTTEGDELAVAVGGTQAVLKDHLNLPL